MSYVLLDIATRPHPCWFAGEVDHDPKYVRDWGGDPSIPYGTFDCSRWECRRCDEECEGGEPDDEYYGFVDREYPPY